MNELIVYSVEKNEWALFQPERKYFHCDLLIDNTSCSRFYIIQELIKHKRN